MRFIYLLLSVLVLSSCIKDKLENESAILVGTWTWDHSIEYTYDDVNQIEVETIIPASNYPDAYGLTFKEKGKVRTHRNNIDLEEYRVILDIFRAGTCDDLVGGYEYRIKLDNKDNDTIVGCVNDDTLTMSDFHLPLVKGSDAYPYYKHVYVK